MDWARRSWLTLMIGEHMFEPVEPGRAVMRVLRPGSRGRDLTQLPMTVTSWIQPRG